MSHAPRSRRVAAGAASPGARAPVPVVVLVVVLVVLAATSVAAAATAAPGRGLPNPDFTRGEPVPEGATHDWTLGPTGLRGWMHSEGLETTTARQVLVTEVDAGSPADGRLRPGDVILGVDDAPFAFDPRVELGRAIGRAEAGDGRLRLRRWRDGRTETLVLRLRFMGAYAPTAPFDCDKSRRILERGCDAIARRMRADPDAGNPMERSLNALALLAGGRPEHLPLVRAQVERAAAYSDPDRRQLHSWWYFPQAMLLAEYVLATGDERAMPALERITMEIVRGQSAIGSWGHRFVQPSGRLAGYGMMHATGVPLTVALALAREAGVQSEALDAAIERSARVIRFYVGKGSVPYGDHHPWTETHDDNGKNGIAAVLFHLLGDAEATEYFSRMSVACHGYARDTGHTGNFFNMLWAMPGVARSGPRATGAWMAEFGWAYDLARRWDGSFRHQGPPQRRPDSYGGWDATGAYLLAYAHGTRSLHLAGRPDPITPPLDAEAAETLIDDGRGWGPRTRLAGYASRPDAAILAGLSSWSPVVRERSAGELARRELDVVPRLVALLRGDEEYGRLGACAAIIALGPRAADAVPALRAALDDGSLWVRVRAAEALAAVGDAAVPAVPRLLRMLAREDPETDPRGMEERYLCFALFDRRDGLLSRSLEGVDRELLYEAVRAGLANEDGRARGTLGSVYRNLSSEEIEPLLPAIHRAVMEPAPSGIMFADGIRLTGLAVLARHRIAEGLPACLDLVDPDRWGMRSRVRPCLDALRVYGGAARSELPRLERLPEVLAARRWSPEEIDALGIPALVAAIRADEDPPVLRSIRTVGGGG